MMSENYGWATSQIEITRVANGYVVRPPYSWQKQNNELRFVGDEFVFESFENLVAWMRLRIGASPPFTEFK